MSRPLLVGLGVIENRRDIGNFRNRRFFGAQQEDELALSDQLVDNAELPVRCAHALGFAAHRGEDGVAHPVIAFDDAKLGVQHLIQHRRNNRQRR